jgi:hypothetical protein
MRPAFSSTRQAAAFATLLLVLLLLPALMGRSWLPPREQIYSSISWHFGSYPYLHQQIFEEKTDIDIAFMGASHIWFGIDTPYIQKELSRKVGHNAVVTSLGWQWPGFDAVYFILEDLLRNRKVHMLVLCDESTTEAMRPHTMSHRWFRFGDNADELAGLPMKMMMSYYSSAILGMPRNLLCLMRSNLPADLEASQKNFVETKYRAPNPAMRMGSLAIQLGYGFDTNFVAYQPTTAAQPSDVCLYSPETEAKFKFTGPRITSLQLYFARKIVALAREHHTKLVILHFPNIAETRSPLIPERECWPGLLGGDVSLVGIPPATLFEGMTDAEVLKLFCDSNHLNRNGQEYFTPIVTPSLLQIYDSEAKH